jgi:hypothetical protein
MDNNQGGNLPVLRCQLSRALISIAKFHTALVKMLAVHTQVKIGINACAESCSDDGSLNKFRLMPLQTCPVFPLHFLSLH